jgi:hypothetical protein
VTNYHADLDFAFNGCPGVPDPTYTQTLDGVVVQSSRPLTESPAGTYRAVIPATYPDYGHAAITTNVPADCAGAPVSLDIYIDPSGIVTDGYGLPVGGASVTLLRADSEAGPFVPVAGGSAIMSPSNRTNPDLTDAAGFFQWDVLTGWYQVSASAAGCVSDTSPSMEVPPARLDLLIKLPCAGPAPAPTVAPVLSGTAQVGSSLTVTQGSWPGAIVYQRTEWLRGGAVVGTGPSYLLTGADAGQAIVARVHARRPDYTQENGAGQVVDFAGTSIDRTSAVVLQAGGGGGGGGGGDPVAPLNTAAPSVSGDARVGKTLTVDPGTWDTAGLSFAYRWKRDGTAIADATGLDYAATPADLGHQVSVTVTATKPGIPDGVAAADPVTIRLGDAPTALTPPVITGDPEPGAVLQGAPGTWDRPGVTFQYQWFRDTEAIADATQSSYPISEADRETELSLMVTATEPGHADGKATSAGLRIPAVEPPDDPARSESVTIARLLDGTVQAPHRAELRIRIARKDGHAVVGPFVVRMSGVPVLTGGLAARDHGTTVIELPHKGRGTYIVRVRYLGNARVEPSSSERQVLSVNSGSRGSRALTYLP